MTNNAIGVMVNSFRLSLSEGIQKAREVGASGIQIYAVRGEMAPENLSASRRKEILDEIRSCGLVVSALCGDLGGHGFAKPEDNAWKIQKSKEIMDLALDLGTNVITTHIGVIPESESHPRWKVMQEACEALGAYGDQVGAYLCDRNRAGESRDAQTLPGQPVLQRGQGQPRPGQFCHGDGR